VRRPWALAWLSIVLVLVAGCAGSHAGGPDATARNKAGAAMIAQLQALPGAKVSAHVTSSLDGGQGNVGVQAQLPAAAGTAALEAVGDSIERTIWRSHLDPLGRISINFTRAGSSASVGQRVYIGTDKKALRDKYGPRPDGLAAN
jgi:hypothetical protein